MKPCGQVAAQSEPVQTGDPISNPSGLKAGQAMEDQLPTSLLEQLNGVLPYSSCSYLCCGEGF